MIKQNPALEPINKIIHDFSYATGLASVLVDVKGNEISPRCNFSPFCERIRANDSLREICNYCDRAGGTSALRDDNIAIYRCHAGLVDFSFPIVHRGNLLGFIQCGQVKVANSDIPAIYSHRNALLEDKHLSNLYKEIEYFSLSKLHSAINMLKTLVDFYFLKILNQSGSSYICESINPITPDSVKYKKKIDDALIFINDNIEHDLTLETVSNHIGLSSCYFSKAFKKQIGVGFNSYLNKRRLANARILLANKKLSIKEVAKKVGFSSTSYFIRQFKECYQKTPCIYRETHK